MLIKVFTAVLLGAFLFAPVQAQDAKEFSADRFDVDVAVQNGGSLHVAEQVDFRFDGGPFTFVFRELPTDHTDGIENIQAGVNGVPWPLGDQPGQVEIEGNDPIRVTWHLPPTNDATLTFDLSYDALGVVRQAENADLLDWQALPEDYDYTIASSEVVFTYPPSAVLQSAPTLLDGEAVFLQPAANTVSISANDLGPNEPLVARLAFAPGTVITSPPAWQAAEQSANQLGWGWVALGALLLLGGGTYLVRSAQPYWRKSPTTKDLLTYAPPSKLSPALAGVVSGDGTSVSWQHALATIFDFANRGHLTIEELADRKWYQGADFVVTLESLPADMLPHEQALIDLAFKDKSGAIVTNVTGTEMGKAISSSRWHKYKDAVHNELVLTNQVDPKRKHVIQRYQVLALLLLLLSTVALVGSVFVRAQFGLWPIIIVGVAVVLGFLSFILSATVSQLSGQGEQVADSWKSFRKYLEQASKGKVQLASGGTFEAYLPYAVSFGVAEGWAKANAKSGYNDVPAYFRSLNDDSTASMAAFIAVISASNNAGGAAAAASSGAAAGAAGGGASGAG